jgi:DNA-binding CsgD family transcriptional regulator
MIDHATIEVPPGAVRAGLILVDSSRNPIWFNAEGMRVLSYPERPENVGRSNALLAEKLRSLIPNGRDFEIGPSATEFTSGRRRYVCRPFVLKSRGKGLSHRAVGLLLERNTAGWNGVCHVAEQFNLTPRECEAIELLLLGLTNKEMADRMNISPNTVKAHIRLLMIKTGVTTRSGLLGKIIAPTALNGSQFAVAARPA